MLYQAERKHKRNGEGIERKGKWEKIRNKDTEKGQEWLVEMPLTGIYPHFSGGLYSPWRKLELVKNPGSERAVEVVVTWETV